ncbi:transcription repressor OFP6-like [Senna tora]|uniref:Transcription repressor n=1 Tax=Senna tora TaxID=362788 RepID=A0A834SIS3_9FABA|nr:transcription repressor OFP6-like [Senna tora]
MSNPRKKLLLSSVSVKLGCSSCRRPKLSHIFHPKPKPKNPSYQKHKLYHLSSSSPSDKYDSSTTTTTTTVDSSHFSDSDHYGSAWRTVGGFGRVGGEGVAVEKDSDDPYLDFRHSMLQMILENEIYSKDDLRELLNCFLQLNSPYHHGVIVRAFTEIWNGVYSSRMRSNSPRFHFTPKSRDF